MSETKTGSCLCGGVRFRVSGPLRAVIACHCRQCRKTSGHFVAATQCAVEDLMQEAAASLRWYRSSPQAERGFCATCGASLFWRQDGRDRISVMAGCLDGPTGLRLEGQLFAQAAGDYYTPPDVPRIDQAALD